MSAIEKFNESDRRLVLAFIAWRFAITLQNVSSRKIYHRDKEGRRYVVLGGYGSWHGIPQDIFESEEKEGADTALIFAKRSEDKIDIFCGKLRALLDRKEHLTKTDTEYEFNLIPSAGGLAVREAPNCRFRKLGEIRRSPEGA